MCLIHSYCLIHSCLVLQYISVKIEKKNVGLVCWPLPNTTAASMELRGFEIGTHSGNEGFKSFRVIWDQNLEHTQFLINLDHIQNWF